MTQLQILRPSIMCDIYFLFARQQDANETLDYGELRPPQ